MTKAKYKALGRNKKKLNLVTLRAQGKSFQAIADSLGISKQTAISWAAELKVEIDNEYFLEVQAVLEANKQTRINKLNAVLELLELANEKIRAKISTEEVTFSELLKLKDSLERELSSLTDNIGYESDQMETWGTDKITLPL